MVETWTLYNPLQQVLAVVLLELRDTHVSFSALLALARPPRLSDPAASASPLATLTGLSVLDGQGPLPMRPMYFAAGA